MSSPAAFHLVQSTLEPHFAAARPILDELDDEQRSFDAWPDAERVQLGLFSPQRQALVFEKTFQEVVEPKLQKLRLV